MMSPLLRPTLLVTAALCAVGASCTLSPAVSAEPEPSIFTQPPQAVGEAALYARDGSVVSPADGAQSGTSPARREVAGAESGRMYLLELYQQVIDERDGLSREVYALRADLDALQVAHGKSQARVIDLEQHNHALQTEQERLQAENFELAGRLTTAQIRRLQAERLLLEHKLAEQRARESAEQAAAPAQEQRP